jgi:hypothetical protein
MRPAVGRHNISNIVIKIDGNKASGRAYWFHYSNDNPKRAGVFDGFGHYEDELVKVKGRWLFAKRRIYNENRDEWAYKGRRTRPGRTVFFRLKAEARNLNGFMWLPPSGGRSNMLCRGVGGSPC